MTRAEHYRAAEALLRRAKSGPQLDDPIKAALVHATLATATKEVEKVANEGGVK